MFSAPPQRSPHHPISPGQGMQFQACLFYSTLIPTLYLYTIYNLFLWGPYRPRKHFSWTAFSNRVHSWLSCSGSISLQETLRILVPTNNSSAGLCMSLSEFPKSRAWDRGLLGGSLPGIMILESKRAGELERDRMRQSHSSYALWSWAQWRAGVVILSWPTMDLYEMHLGAEQMVAGVGGWQVSWEKQKTCIYCLSFLVDHMWPHWY